MAPVRQFQVTFDCADPERVARFWCEVLGYVVPPPPEGFADWDAFDGTLPPEEQGSAFACVDPTGVGPRLFFQRVPEGKVVKNRVHLDLTTTADDRDAEIERLIGLGARRVDVGQTEQDSWDVLADPEGNEFCVVRPKTSLVA